MQSALGHRVLHVVRLRTKKEMVRPDTERRVAAVQDAQRWDGAVMGDSPRDDVCAPRTALVVALAVRLPIPPRDVPRSLPEPAIVASLDLRPEAAFVRTEPTLPTSRLRAARALSGRLDKKRIARRSEKTRYVNLRHRAFTSCGGVSCGSLTEPLVTIRQGHLTPTLPLECRFCVR